MPDLNTYNLAKNMTGQTKYDVGQAMKNNSTTANLTSLGSNINTQYKYAGKIVYNTDTNVLVVAEGAQPGSIWRNAGTGVPVHSPA
jgi:hypothetical protein